MGSFPVPRVLMEFGLEQSCFEPPFGGGRIQLQERLERFQAIVFPVHDSKGLGEIQDCGFPVLRRIARKESVKSPDRRPISPGVVIDHAPPVFVDLYPVLDQLHEGEIRVPGGFVFVECVEPRRFGFLQIAQFLPEVAHLFPHFRPVFLDAGIGNDCLVEVKRLLLPPEFLEPGCGVGFHECSLSAVGRRFRCFLPRRHGSRNVLLCDLRVCNGGEHHVGDLVRAGEVAPQELCRNFGLVELQVRFPSQEQSIVGSIRAFGDFAPCVRCLLPHSQSGITTAHAIQCFCFFFPRERRQYGCEHLYRILALPVVGCAHRVLHGRRFRGLRGGRRRQRCRRWGWRNRRGGRFRRRCGWRTGCRRGERARRTGGNRRQQNHHQQKGKTGVPKSLHTNLPSHNVGRFYRLPPAMSKPPA